jgi:hypothetical protein
MNFAQKRPKGVFMPARKTYRCAKPCDECARNFECGVLFSALTILAKHEAITKSEECRRVYEEFVKKVKALGYGYPYGSTYCRLRNDKRHIRKLLDEAIELNDLFTSLGTEASNLACPTDRACL